MYRMQAQDPVLPPPGAIKYEPVAGGGEGQAEPEPPGAALVPH